MYGALLISRDTAFVAHAAKYVHNINKDINILGVAGIEPAMALLEGPEQIDVIICDHTPPEIDAVAFFNERSRVNDFRPFIVVSPELDGGLAIRAFELRMDYYISRAGSVMNFYMDLARKIVLCAERRHSEVTRELNERRLRALVALADMHSRPLTDIINYALEASVSLTDSQIGYVAIYDQKKRQLKMIAWSKNAMNACRTQMRPIFYDLDSTGVWGEPVRSRQTVIINDYATDTVYEKKGTPIGHVSLNRLLMIPIIHNGVVVATAGVGNKVKEYSADDENQLRLLMDGLVSNYEERMLQEENQRTEQTLRSILSTAPVGLLLTDLDLHFIECNAYAQQVLSISDTERLTLGLDQCQGAGAVKIAAAMQAAKIDDKGRDTYLNISSEGREIEVYVSISPVLDLDHKATGYLAVLTDVTKYAQKGVSMREIMGRMRSFGAMINSELKDVAASMQQRAAATVDPACIKNAEETAERLGLVQQFIDSFSRVGMQSPEWQRLADAVGTLPEELSTAVHVSGIRILADRTFGEVFRMLGHQSLVSGATAALVSARIDGGRLTVSYSDNGRGVPQESKGIMFTGMLSTFGSWALMIGDIIRVSGFAIREIGVPGRGMEVEISVPSSCYSVDIG